MKGSEGRSEDIFKHEEAIVRKEEIIKRRGGFGGGWDELSPEVHSKKRLLHPK
jgi:hypothetical protein